MNDWVVLQKGHVAEFMKKYDFVRTKNTWKDYSSFTH